jgi:hypothetical protein
MKDLEEACNFYLSSRICREFLGVAVCWNGRDHSGKTVV